jgi:hypothetical protein
MPMKQQLTNRKLLIKLMQHVKKMEQFFNKELFDLRDFQSSYKISKTKSQVINCGTTCCVSGWVAICPAFTEQGVRQGEYLGEARLKDLDETETMVELLGIDYSTAHNLIITGDYATSPSGYPSIDDVIKFVKSFGRNSI